MSGVTAPHPQRIVDDVVQAAASAYPHAGFAAAVFVDGVIHESAAGSANPELGAEMTPTTLAQIGSTTKVLNAALVMRLVQDGTLDLNRPVADVIEGFRLSDDEASETVTLRHCLTMTSGIDTGPFVDYGFEADCLSRYVEQLVDVVQLFPPGGGFGYSNAGIVVSGLAAEVATGRRWDDLLKEHILDPAGMANTETLTERLLYHRTAVGVAPDGSVTRPWYRSRSAGPAGSTCASTAADLVRFASLFVSKGRSTAGAEVLSPETVTAMTKPVVSVATGFPAEHWCLGPGWTNTGEHVILGHPGSNASGGSALWWVPSLGLAVAFITNSPAALGAVFNGADSLLREFGCEPPPAPVGDPAGRIEGGDFTGVYESGLMRYEVTARDDGLYVNMHGRSMLLGQFDTMARLLPAGKERFVPEHPLLPGMEAPSAVAFRDYAGTRVMLNANAAARRVADGVVLEG